MSTLLDLVKQSQMRDDLPEMHPGDTVRVHARIIEGNKERIQVYEGVIIAIRRAQNASNITVRRTSHAGIGVERTFLMHSPRIDRFEVVRRGKVRRAKLYYLRDRQGKSARIKELQPVKLTAEARAAARAARAAASAPAPVAAVAATAAAPDMAEPPAAEAAQSVTPAETAGSTAPEEAATAE